MYECSPNTANSTNVAVFVEELSDLDHGSYNSDNIQLAKAWMFSLFHFLEKIIVLLCHKRQFRQGESEVYTKWKRDHIFQKIMYILCAKTLRTKRVFSLSCHVSFCVLSCHEVSCRVLSLRTEYYLTQIVFGSRDPPILKAYSNHDVILRLPPGKRIRDIKWLSVWCRRFTVSLLNLSLN